MTTKHIPLVGRRASFTVGGALLCAVSVATPVWAKHHATGPAPVIAVGQKSAMKALKNQQRQQWANLHRQQSQESKMNIDKATLYRLQKDQRDALKRQQKLQKQLLKGR